MALRPAQLTALQPAQLMAYSILIQMLECACGLPQLMYGLALTVNPRMCEQRTPVASMYQAFASKHLVLVANINGSQLSWTSVRTVRIGYLSMVWSQTDANRSDHLDFQRASAIGNSNCLPLAGV
jgi:hypothetical protein